MKALSLFAGAGGFDLGARMAGLDVVASIEREALPAQALALNGFHPVQADVTQVDYSQWHGVDVVFGGPPCQGHSIANSSQRSTDDPRNLLAWEMVRAARETQARHILIENVITMDPALLSGLCAALTKLGYWVSSVNLMASNYGVPQDRRRRFIWASHDLMHVWPEPTHIRQRVSIDAALKGLSFRPGPLPQWLMAGGIKSSWRLVDAQNKSKFGEQGRPGHMPAYTMTSGSYYHRVRTEAGNYGMLDPHGMARLQSFPDDYQFCGNRDQRGLQIGNAVPPLLAYHLLRGAV